MEIPKRNATHALREHVARGPRTPEGEARRIVERAAENDEAAAQAEAEAPERRRAAGEALRDLVRHESAANLAHVATRITERTTTKED